MDLSIIIPVWNEQSKIARDILNIDTYLRQANRKGELIIADDGSTDNTLVIIKETLAKLSLPSQCLRHDHKGKGYAVRQGIKASRGSVVLFMDCGANVPLEYIDKGIHLLTVEKADIILGTRYRPQSTIIHDRIWYRKVTSTIFRRFVNIWLNLPQNVSDSQCGFKIFRGDLARQLFENSRIDGFLFDLEVILAASRMGHKMTELPLRWRCDRDSRLRISSSLFPVIKELIYLRKI
jgi:dolichyl-phosphate beta-glucosyltransferase